jgi:predicted DCC family thiol-disulfide oxidoreductase YuxK
MSPHADARTPRLTVYYDGSCPLCTREIAYYQRSPAASGLLWVDVSRAADLGPGLDCQSAMQRFHVRDSQGRLHHGAAGFARLWRELPGWRWQGRLLALPPLGWLAEAAYRLFLPLRPLLQRALRSRQAQKTPLP